ncbi:hypothetical protein FB451DRAFT_1395279 [Mycena latifolia]|nr:hypothetical protein FB451DRAFT_1395279 [Mycena latifolia]
MNLARCRPTLLTTYSDVFSPTSAASDTGNSQKASRVPTAVPVVFGAVLGLFLIVSIVLFRRRKRRRMHPQQYTAVEPHLVKETGVSTPNSPVVENRGPIFVVGNLLDPDTARVAAGEPAVPIPEAITQRMHELEAQIEALLTLGQPDGSPPEYTSI